MTNGTISRSEVITEFMSDLSATFTFVRSLWHEHLEEIHPELTRGSLPTLLTIARLKSTTATDVASALGTDKTTISKNVALLKQLQLVDTTVSDEDGRVFFLQVSEFGMSKITATRELFSSYLERHFTDWSDEDVASLHSLLRRFLDS